MLEVTIEGECQTEFSKLRDVFAASFTGENEHPEVGASICVYLDGRKVVDLWGGYADRARERPWRRDTIVNMMSVAKGVLALCAHILVDRGQLNLDAPVADYWPEFGQKGKETLPVRFLLDHRAGLAAVDDLRRGMAYDWDAMVGALETTAPMHPPGSTPCYHSITMGHLVGEVVRRISGQDIGAFMAANIAEPLGLDYHFGLKADEVPRCADFLEDEGQGLAEYLLANPDALAARTFGPIAADESFNSPEWRQSLVPSANGHGNARALARLYGALALGGSLDGVRIIGRDTLLRAAAEQWDDTDLATGIRMRMALGFRLGSADTPMGPNRRAFGSPGAGGATSFCDMDAGIGFGYAMNAKYPGLAAGPRAATLVAALYDCEI
ncbi:MAG: beta-lactamase family protein [Rhodospirillaceae bacterium]|jgi:CubicO group peptidase (beta-lactamase class C family)|nr:beta-lactamase family protein [Rhodospirillaceae bacterium]MBT5191992.1 beta-lactamase family protein [Rhodospirillaceae bacterium]MBT5897333.1 beta-lactamase family protein [Rhodospirillaceae bacterium]MBT6428635.1 beta-lactamase family protein [Rhodospirillaceae bacterium]MBT7757835.1 beta-lactamase family protein [Rhodospirillaceae bacterium]